MTWMFFGCFDQHTLMKCGFIGYSSKGISPQTIQQKIYCNMVFDKHGVKTRTADGHIILPML